MNELIKQRLEALREEIALYQEMGIAPVKKLTGITAAVRRALDELTRALIDREAGPASLAAFIRDDQPLFFDLITAAQEEFSRAAAKPFGAFNDEHAEE